MPQHWFDIVLADAGSHLRLYRLGKLNQYPFRDKSRFNIIRGWTW